MTDKSKEEISEEVESDPMKGVTEIKGADAPMEAKVDLDIKTHQDAADPDLEGAAGHKHGVDPAAQTAQPQSANTSAPSNASAPSKTNGGGRSKILIFLLILCFLCLICCITTYALRDRILQIVTNSTSRQDTTLTTVTQEDIAASTTDLDTLLEQKKAEGMANSVDGTYPITFTEEELLTAAFANTQGFDPSAIGLKFETGMAKVQIDIGKILKSQGTNLQNNRDLQNLPFDLSMLNGVILNADIVAAADGKSLSIRNLTTGNPVLDSLIPQEALRGLENQIDLEEYTKGEDGPNLNVESIEFLPGQLRLIVRE